MVGVNLHSILLKLLWRVVNTHRESRVKDNQGAYHNDMNQDGTA